MRVRVRVWVNKLCSLFVCVHVCTMCQCDVGMWVGGLVYYLSLSLSIFQAHHLLCVDLIAAYPRGHNVDFGHFTNEHLVVYLILVKRGWKTLLITIRHTSIFFRFFWVGLQLLHISCFYLFVGLVFGYYLSYHIISYHHDYYCSCFCYYCYC